MLSGSMPLPPTGQRIASGIFNGFIHNGLIHDLGTNIELGTNYMRYIFDQLGGNAVLATAGYNAGPSRAKKWMAEKPLEAAIYIESIPFAETRGYVQKVMANAQMYAPRLSNGKQMRGHPGDHPPLFPQSLRIRHGPGGQGYGRAPAAFNGKFAGERGKPPRGRARP